MLSINLLYKIRGVSSWCEGIPSQPPPPARSLSQQVSAVELVGQHPLLLSPHRPSPLNRNKNQ